MAQEYARALAKIVVAQTAETLGFDSVQQSAIDALAELLLQYISELGSLTHGYAELAGRTDCNINDLLMAFQNMGIDAKELMDFAESTEEVPFAHTISAFPVAKPPPHYQSFAQKGEEPPAHIPAFLPVFPDEHTYKDTPAFRAHTKDSREQKLAQQKARRDAEKAIVKLASRQTASKAAPSSSLLAKSQGVNRNLFLAPPETEERKQTADQSNMDVDQPSAAANASPVAWQEATAAASSRNLLEAPLQLDWTMPMGPSIHRSLSQMGFEDAFANAAEEIVDKGGRKRRLSLKAKAAGDPSIQRAEQILAAGANAMFLEEAGEKEKDKEKEKGR